MAHQIIECTDKAAIAAHLIHLPKHDRYLRFCFTATDFAINRYVFDRIDFSNPTHKAFVVMEGDQIIGLCNTGAIDETTIELAFSVDPDKRHQGIAGALFDRAVAFVKQLGYKKVLMSCLATNNIIQHLALRHGMKIETKQGESIGVLDT